MHLKKILSILTLIFITCIVNISCKKDNDTDLYSVSTVISEGKGTISKNPSQKYYEKGSVVNVKAIPNSNYEFNEWKDENNNNSERAVIVNSDIIVKARFKEKNNSGSTNKGFVHANGNKIYDSAGNELLLKGISFGNQVWNEFSTATIGHHDENSYAELKAFGFNNVRFYLNYQLFENDENTDSYESECWTWIDKNIKWAKANNIGLILNMHVPPGGFQSLGEGKELWTKQKNQDKLVALWKKIAEKYKNEETIIGYDLLNEPIVPLKSTTEDTISQWKNLAERLVKNIREVDENHLIFVERLNNIIDYSSNPYKTRWDLITKNNMGVFSLSDIDDNIAYEFHFYEPMKFTHQNASWLSEYKGKFSKYPDEDIIETVGELTLESTTAINATLTNKTSTEWQTIESNSFKISNSKYKCGRVTLQAYNLGENGYVYFDFVTVQEFDENNNISHTFEYPITSDSKDNWSFWAENTGSGTYEDISDKNHYSVLKISGTDSDSNFGNNQNFISLKENYSYKIIAYAKGVNLSDSSQVKARIDLYDGGYSRNKSYLEASLLNSVNLITDAPVYLGEFGVITDAFDNNRGGEQWVADVIDICKKNNINFNYHTYHEENFGLYKSSDNTLPSSEYKNKKLANVFENEL